MKKGLFLVSFGLFLTSCLTVGKIERNCDKFMLVCGQRVDVRIQYRDTVVPLEKNLNIQLPVSHIDVSGELKYDPQKRLDMSIKETDGIITTELRLKGDDYHLKSYLNDSSIQYKYRDSIKIEKVNVYKDKIVEIPVKYVPLHYKILSGMGLGVLFYLALLLYFKRKK